MSARGSEWQAWVDGLAAVVDGQVEQWELRPDGPATHGASSLVLAVHTPEGAPAVLKVSFPDAESEHAHLVLRRWGGDGAARLLRIRRTTLVEKLRKYRLSA